MPDNNDTPATTPADAVARLRSTFESGRTQPYEWRKEQLQLLARMIKAIEPELIEALHKDFGKPSFEVCFTESGISLSDIDYALKYLRKWMRPTRVPTSLLTQPARSMIHSIPYGVVLIIGPWNYPFQLMISPMIAAIAAGNTVLLKPSELTPNTSAIIMKGVTQFLDSEAFSVIEGGAEITTKLLEEQFDHIFFTGGERVGKIVMAAAAKHLTPVTLELGGKSPCIVTADATLKTAARRIAWGKFMNAGQTCVAPDYLLIESNCAAAFETHLKEAIQSFYGDDPKNSPDFCRIVSSGHWKRLCEYLKQGTLVTGGEVSEEDRYIAPTVIKDIDWESDIMASEIFGPILPMLTFENLDDAIAQIRARPDPLALYLFSNNPAAKENILAKTRSGGLCVNDVILHLTVPSLPFGGLGPSGMGNYHGKAGFDTFSHQRSVLSRTSWPDPSLRYPPYSDTKLAWIKRLH